MRKLFLILVISLFISLKAQTPPGGFNLTLLPGYLMVHHQEMKQMEAHSMGFQLEYGFKGRSPLFNFVQNYGLLYLDIGKPEINGKAIALTVGTESYITDKVIFKMGTGIGYLTKRFDINNNLLNRAIGTHLNGCLQLSCSRKIYENNTSLFNLGLGLTHFSNASFKRPNFGVNFVNAVLSYKIKGKRLDTISKKSTSPFFQQFDFHLAYAKKEMSISDIKVFHIVNVSGNYILNWKRKNYAQYITGLSLMVDPSNKYEHYQADDTPKPTFFEMAELSATFGREWRLGKIDLVADVGVYLLRPNNAKMPLYQRVGVKYNVHPSVYILGRLKTHLSTADNFEFGVGYRYRTTRTGGTPVF